VPIGGGVHGNILRDGDRRNTIQEVIIPDGGPSGKGFGYIFRYRSSNPSINHSAPAKQDGSALETAGKEVRARDGRCSPPMPSGKCLKVCSLTAA